MGFCKEQIAHQLGLLYNASGSNFHRGLWQGPISPSGLWQQSAARNGGTRVSHMISSKSVQSSYSRKSAFPADAHEVLRRVRRAIAEMFDSVPGGISKSRDVQKLFGVSTKLSWQIFKLAGPGDALSLAPHVPKGEAMRRVLEGAEKYGVPARLINEVRAAYSAFEELIETHAGDRTSFESMARGLSIGDDTGQADVQHRKAIF